MTVEYDGTNFAGWQIQADQRTVQGELAQALSTVLGEPISPTGSGRTDAGTHALGQVAHFHSRQAPCLHRLQRALNGILPADIAVRQLAKTGTDFHARYSAQSKRYRYRITQRKIALNRCQVWPYYRLLDMDLMGQATTALLGSHNFRAFCKLDPVPKSFDCHILDASWKAEEDLLVFEIEANRFLRHMVRILVGTLVEIGLGKRPPDSLAPLLDGAERQQAGATVPACGLCLLWVRYPDE